MSKILSRDNLAKTLDIFKINKILNITRDNFVKDLRILAYHRVCDHSQCNDNDISLISANEDQFEWQVDHVNRNYDLINFEDLKDIINRKIKKPKRPVIITFDDGFLDNYMNAYPILKKHRAKATFFVSTGYIGTRNNFWFNQVYQSFQNPENKSALINDLEVDIIFSADKDERQEEIYTIIEALKKCPNSKRLELIEYIAENYPPRDFDENLNLPMSWEQLKEMSNNSMEIASHTINHPVLSTLTEKELVEEIHESKLVIEKMCGRSVSAIAYPVGMSFAYNDNILQQVRSAEYMFGASYIAGTNYFNKLNFHDLKRIHVECYTTKAMFKAMLSFPELFAVY
ncbi:Polysaccharide deacetylase [hydrothermal vent metagenome]|uniref:Polysaccharide deacetylase n=1 Tax=hydrothermal vent metagenome TaxID=652676 RepID=A0A3B0YC59_9ZZZZ